MKFPHSAILIVISVTLVRGPLLAYGPTGHEIVGGIADKLIADTPAAERIYALTDGITLERASTIADEIRAWDKSGVDDLNAFPHYVGHSKIDKQLRDFWRANPPAQDPKSAVPSHHWFHYTDVPILNLQKYADGKIGRSQWDVVHMISYCVNVLRDEVPESNPRKIAKPIAVILLAHYVGDIHQPLHVGAEYFNHAGKVVDPDQGQAGIDDEGGNLIFLHLAHGPPDELAKRGVRLHGFWDNEGVTANLPTLPPDLTPDERSQLLEPAKRKLIDRLAKEEPTNWRAPVNLALQKYPEYWADEILPLAREAHERLQFRNVHETIDQNRIVMAGDAREKSMPDHIDYAKWSGKIVRDELHKAGWRLADLLSQCVKSTSSNPTSSPTP
jgi:S1/P1 Nuclease